jgi:hypothetical protein
MFMVTKLPVDRSAIRVGKSKAFFSPEFPDRLWSPPKRPVEWISRIFLPCNAEVKERVEL